VKHQIQKCKQNNKRILGICNRFSHLGLVSVPSQTVSSFREAVFFFFQFFNMFFARLFLLFSILGTFYRLIYGKVALNECEKRVHTSFSPSQKQEICSNYDNDYSIGPAICSIGAKDKLHLPYKDILKLCYHAVSDGPVDCMLAIPTSLRSSVGYSLCNKATSALPAKCYSEINTLVKSSSEKDNVIKFCHNLQDISPLKCVTAALSPSVKLPIPVTLTLCKNTIGSGDYNSDSSDPLNEMTSVCIKDMASSIQPSLGLTSEVIVKFCSEINPLQYFFNLNELSFEDKATFHTASRYCYQNLTIALQDKTVSSPSVITPRDRLDICANALSALGPVNCTIQTLNKLKLKESSQKLTGIDLKHLCRYALNGNGPSECFLESNGIGNITLRANLCNSAENAVKYFVCLHMNHCFVLSLFLVHTSVFYRGQLIVIVKQEMFLKMMRQIRIYYALVLYRKVLLLVLRKVLLFVPCSFLFLFFSRTSSSLFRK
jgi:hypothetical protein